LEFFRVLVAMMSCRSFPTLDRGKFKLSAALIKQAIMVPYCQTVTRSIGRIVKPGESTMG